MAISTSDNDIKERLSWAYLTAVAARAGCQITGFPVDKESVDATVRPVQGSSRQIDLQLKATSANVFEGEQVKYKSADEELRNVAPGGPHQPALPGHCDFARRLLEVALGFAL